MSKATGYTGTAKSLHWLILALLIVQFVVAWTMLDIKRDTKPDTLINLHLSAGILILFFVVVRLAWRATHGEPAPLDGGPPWQVQSARLVPLHRGYDSFIGPGQQLLWGKRGPFWNGLSQL